MAEGRPRRKGRSTRRKTVARRRNGGPPGPDVGGMNCFVLIFIILVICGCFFSCKEHDFEPPKMFRWSCIEHTDARV